MSTLVKPPALHGHRLVWTAGFFSSRYILRIVGFDDISIQIWILIFYYISILDNFMTFPNACALTSYTRSSHLYATFQFIVITKSFYTS